MPFDSFLGSVGQGQPLLWQSRARLTEGQSKTALYRAASEAIQLVEGHRSHRPQLLKVHLLLLLDRGLLALFAWLSCRVA